MHKTLSLVLLATFAVVVFPPGVADAQDKPRIAVLEFTNKADPSWGWWRERGAAAMQDVFITELVKSGKFRVIDRERLDLIMQAKKVSLSGEVDQSTAMQMGKLLGVEYLLVGAVTEYGKTDPSAHGRGVKRLPGFGAGRSTFVAAANARIMNAETGEIVWADEARFEDSNTKVSVDGENGELMFDKVMKPVVQELAASIKNADL